MERDLKGIWEMEDWGKSFENCCEWRVGDGKDILFWKDVWVGNEDLKSKFPRLFCVVIKKVVYSLVGSGLMIDGSGS